MDPAQITSETLKDMRYEVAREYGIVLYKQVSEKEAACLLLPPDQRPDGPADTSTLKRNRRKGKVPYVAHGDGSIRYLGVMLCDYILFGEFAVRLWGSKPSQDDEKDLGTHVFNGTAHESSATDAR